MACGCSGFWGVLFSSGSDRFSFVCLSVWLEEVL